ncbi:ABC transporter ATP-binding protein [Mesorhizobium sp. CAU 1732]|uniref:ABC transporter ATP-binding protein n=1 Tax=Mesorhizobium sp. CAU 1732 TaxID=3140358 RepID=UPI00326196D6
MTLLAISDLRARLGNTDVLDGVSLEIQSGEFVGLIGPNGAGKSTLLRAILGLTPSQGGIELAGRSASGIASRDRARLVSYLPQEREIAWPVTVHRLVSLGRAPHLRAFASQSVHDQQAIVEAMRRMDVAAFAERPATDLSGGEKARVLIARALVQEAPLMLADEPTAGLDASHQIALMRLFAELAGEGKGVLVSLHDLGLAARWCTRLILIDGGKIVAQGTPADVLSPDRLRDVYGIRAYVADSDGRLIVHPLDLAEPR